MPVGFDPVDFGLLESSTSISGHGASRRSPSSSRCCALDSLELSIRSVASAGPLVDYCSLVEYAKGADIELVPYSKLEISKTMLGRGAYMTVFRGSCTDMFGDLSLAIKMIDIPLPRGGSELARFTDDWIQQLNIVSLELRVFSNRLLRCHPNIVRLLGISFFETTPDPTSDDGNGPFFKPIMILEEAHQDHPTLEKFFARARAKGEQIPIDVKSSLWCDVANALSAVHTVGVIHGDVKPANVLLFRNRGSRKLIAKLSDFGGCQPADAASDARIRYDLLGTEYWNAPEVHDRGHPHYRSSFRDCFSFGLLGFYILFESYPFGEPESLTAAQREGLRESKMNRKGLCYYISESLTRKWPHISTQEAAEHMRSLPQATDPASFGTRIAAYRRHCEDGNIGVGALAAPLHADAQFGIRFSKNPDYRPFAMALAISLFVHSEPEKRDRHSLLGNLSTFLDDERLGVNLRDICGSCSWHYVLELLDNDDIVPWQLTAVHQVAPGEKCHKWRICWAGNKNYPETVTFGWDELKAVPESLRTMLKTAYEDRLHQSSGNERIGYLLALASLSIDSVDDFMAYNVEAAQLGSLYARKLCAMIGHSGICANVPPMPQLNRWALETILHPVGGTVTFLARLEKACPAMLESDEILTQLMGDVRDLHALRNLYGDCSPWTTDADQTPTPSSLAALAAVVGRDVMSLRRILESGENVLDARFANGDALIHVAAELDRAKMVTLLVNEYKVDPDLANAAGMTPLTIAAINNCSEVVAVLLSIGAEYKHLLSARITRYMANMSGGPMITYLAFMPVVLEKEWGLLPNATTRPCPSPTELLDGNFSFFSDGGDDMPESELAVRPIFASIMGDNLPALHALLQHGCSRDAWLSTAAPSAADPQAEVVYLAPIHLACQLRPLYLAVLLYHGADVNCETGGGLRQTPLHLACTAVSRPCYRYPCSRLGPEIENIPLPKLAETRLCMLRLLAGYGLTNFDAQDGLGKTALHHCMARRGCLPVMQTLVRDYHADLAIRDAELMTPLHHAASPVGQEPAYVEFCLAHLPDGAIDQPDVQGLTPLMWVVIMPEREQRIDLCELLVARGCSLTRRSRWGATILHLADRDDEIFAHVFGEVARRGLLSALADLADVRGRTFAHVMARSKHPRIRAYLRRLPAESLWRLAKRADLAGLTLLHEAARAGDADLVEFLVEHGADVRREAAPGLTPLRVAQAGGHSAVARSLRSHVAEGEENEEPSPQHWRSLLDRLETEQDVRVQGVMDEVAADVEKRKQLFRAWSSDRATDDREAEAQALQ